MSHVNEIWNLPGARSITLISIVASTDGISGVPIALLIILVEKSERMDMASLIIIMVTKIETIILNDFLVPLYC